MTKYLSKNLWKQIQILSEKKNKELVVISPYIGSNINNIINFKEDDTLIASVTISNVQQGNVNPYSLAKLITKGVNIYSIENLHSKIYYFEDSVIVGSSNLSENSKNNLVESGIWTNDKEVLLKIDSEISELLQEEISLEFINSLKKHYSPPRKKRRRKSNSGYSSDIWILSTIESEFTDEENNLLNSKKEEYELLLKEGHELNDIKFEVNDSFINKVKIGDRIIEVRENIIYSPQKILGIELGPEMNGKIEVKFLRIETSKTLKKHNIEDLKKQTRLEIDFEAVERKLNLKEKRKVMDYIS